MRSGKHQGEGREAVLGNIAGHRLPPMLNWVNDTRSSWGNALWHIPVGGYLLGQYCALSPPPLELPTKRMRRRRVETMSGKECSSPSSAIKAGFAAITS